MINKITKILWKQKPNDVWQDPDPEDLSVDNAYKTRWIWYHTILGILLGSTNILLTAILIILAIKL